MCVERTPPMSAATAETASSSSYHARSTGSVESSKLAVASCRNRSASAEESPPSASARSARARSSGGKTSRASRNASRRCCRSAEKNLRSLGVITDVKTRNGLRASSPESIGRNAVETTGTALVAASRRS